MATNKTDRAYQGISDEELAKEEQFLSGLPYMHLGAFICSPVWGLGHGDWLVILFYPIWMFVDNVIFSAYSNPTVLNIALAVIISVAVLAVTVFYARIATVKSAHKAADKGVSREAYLGREKAWSVAMVLVAIAVIALATYYNLFMRTPM